jgi:hypothetical protein
MKTLNGKKSDFCDQQILNYGDKLKEIQSISVIFLKFVTSVRVGHCNCSPQASNNLTTA